MHPTQRALVRTLNTYQNTPKTTSELVAAVYPQEYHAIQQGLRSTDTTQQKQAKRTKAKLHRKLLYYLNKLKEKGIIEVVDIKERGEKTYQLALYSDELILQDDDETIAITREEKPQSYIQSEQEQQKIHQYTTALHKIEAYAINAAQYPGVTHLRSELNHVYTHIADAILLYNFHTLLHQDLAVLKEATQQLIADTQDFQVAITLHIDLTKHTLSQQDIQLISYIALHRPKQLYILFSADTHQLHAQQALLEQVIYTLASHQLKVNIHNKTADTNPHYLGRAGTYKLTTQQATQLAQTKAVVVCTTSLAIDYHHITSAKQLIHAAKNAAKTLFSQATTQRRISNKALAGLHRIAPIHDQLVSTETCLRMWNYAIHQDYLTVLSELKRELHTFTNLQKQIYASCGVPIQFNIQLTSAYAHYADMSKREYHKKAVYSREHLTNQQLKTREQLIHAYDTDRVRVFREGTLTGNELLTEIQYITDTYALPLLTYDFKELQKTISLESFI